MPRGYFLGEFEITDPATYEIYRTKVPDIILAHGGRLLVRGGDPLPLDGTMPQRRFVIVEFDNSEAAKAFYASGAYQAVLPFRLNTSTNNGFACLLTGSNAGCCKREFLSRRLRSFHAKSRLVLRSIIDLRVYAPICGKGARKNGRVRPAPTSDGRGAK